MWPWIKRWRDWAMHDLWPLYRIGPQPQALHYSYEKAGLTIHDQPIPWSAEAVLVEALLRLPVPSARRKADFALRLAGQQPQPIDMMRRQETEDRYRLTCRIPPPDQPTTAELLWRNHVMGQLTLPVMGRVYIIHGLRMHIPTIIIHHADEILHCPT